MPELPEVEIVRRSLEPLVVGQVIKEVLVFHLPIVGDDLTFAKKLVNQTINSVSRIGKFLIFTLDNCVLVSHLRMEGKYFYKKEVKDYLKHQHVIFKLNNGFDLIYEDTRKFGRFMILPLDYQNYPPFTKLGAEPFSLDSEVLYSKLKNKHITIKEALLDQHIIAGLGNIYVNEVLFMVKIHPSMPAYLVSQQDCRNIIKSSIQVLNDATNGGGSTIKSYQSLNGIHGMFQSQFKIYGKNGKPCGVCGSIIYKYQLKNRGTYACSTCQSQHIVGITGGVASGKSTVGNYLSSKGYFVINSDDIVSEIYQNPYHIHQINQLFDLGSNHTIDREKLANLVFNDQKLLTKLNDYVHPLVFTAIKQAQEQSGQYFVFIEMPLLFETGYQKNCKQTILVDLKEETQLARLTNRSGINKDAANKIIKNQMKREEKIKLADIIINNDGTIDELYYQIDLYLKNNLKGRG